MNELLVITPAELLAWSALVAAMTVTLIVIIWLAVRLRRSGCSDCTAHPGVGIEAMPGHPERVDVLPDPVEERTFGAIGDRLRADEQIAKALQRCGWDE
ncbi:hypothetical protein [Actinomadura sp. WMMA1423]|uniref:hypothetical protein n=1 Tax=Actinomadura sp. WMMA1423 TaxID=2591108 RepID=UPI0011467875|nr:hypothetical protein [Actinomadura sp. WMMA1423]